MLRRSSRLFKYFTQIIFFLSFGGNTTVDYKLLLLIYSWLSILFYITLKIKYIYESDIKSLSWNLNQEEHSLKHFFYHP